MMWILTDSLIGWPDGVIVCQLCHASNWLRHCGRLLFWPMVSLGFNTLMTCKLFSFHRAIVQSSVEPAPVLHSVFWLCSDQDQSAQAAHWEGAQGFYQFPVTLQCPYMSVMQSTHTLKLHSCELLSSGLCQDLQVEWCQFLVHQTVSGEDPSVRPRIHSGWFYSVGLSFLLQESPVCLPPSLCLYSFFRTLFKFVKKFEDALNGPCVPALVEQGSGSTLDTVDPNTEDTPIHRVHRALKSAQPGKGRDLQVWVSQSRVFVQPVPVVFFMTVNNHVWMNIFTNASEWGPRWRSWSFITTGASACFDQEDEKKVCAAAEEKPGPWPGWRPGLLHW